VHSLTHYPLCLHPLRIYVYDLYQSLHFNLDYLTNRRNKVILDRTIDTCNVSSDSIFIVQQSH